MITKNRCNYFGVLVFWYLDNDTFRKYIQELLKETWDLKLRKITIYKFIAN